MDRVENCECKNPQSAMFLENVDDLSEIVTKYGRTAHKSRNTILECLDVVLSHRHGCKSIPITIADIGTSDGRSSLQIFNDIIDKIQLTLGLNQPIMVVHADQPENDFNLLFRVLQGTEDNDLAGLKLGPSVFSSVIGRTMYEQCLPDEYVDISFSALTASSLSRRPCKIKDGVSYCDANDEERAIIKEQSRKDWKKFLLLRGRELKPGGYLIVLNIGIHMEGHVSQQLNGGMVQLSRILHSMLEDGIISEEEFLDTNHDSDMYRTKEEHSLPFQQKDQDLVDIGLELVSVRSFMNDRDHTTFEIKDKDEATKREYAESIVAGVKPWFYHVVYNGLSTKRTPEERRNVTDLYFSRLWDFSFENSDFKPDMAVVEVVVKKKT